jgi:sirohydrochlorin ferrochelatase
MRAILLIDHGSVRAEANHMLECMANLLQSMVGPSTLVRFAHMELAEPTVAQAFGACVRDGATDIVAFPYMLSPGKHSTRDIPRLVAASAREFPQVSFTVTAAFGMHEKLAEIVAERAGVAVVHRVNSSETSRCWNPDDVVGACGDACACTPADRSLPTERSAARS